MKKLNVISMASIPVAMLAMTVSTIYYQRKTAADHAFTQATLRNNQMNYLTRLEEIERKSKGL